MSEENRFLVDVGINDLPFPIVVKSRSCPEGQHTVATIAIKARIMREFEPHWIDRFIQIVHEHRDRIGLKELATNIRDYHERLNANNVHVDMAFPFFYEKVTPVSHEKCLVRYLCTYSGTYPSVVDKGLRVSFHINCPAITSYPAGNGSFGQLSHVHLEVMPKNGELFPEDLIELVDRHALAPVYSYLTPEDQEYVMKRISEQRKTSVVMVDEIKTELARNPAISWYFLNCDNFGMLHVYNTAISTEKSYWVPFSGIEDQEI
ncbi:MAG TPA: GTP cyclohydrolase, FolE2/MptA family [Spirochaetia bacterium]